MESVKSNKLLLLEQQAAFFLDSTDGTIHIFLVV